MAASLYRSYLIWLVSASFHTGLIRYRIYSNLLVLLLTVLEYFNSPYDTPSPHFSLNCYSKPPATWHLP
jgi:hypothetical protein